MSRLSRVRFQRPRISSDLAIGFAIALVGSIAIILIAELLRTLG